MVAVFVIDGRRRCRFLNAVAEALAGMSTAAARDSDLGDVLWRRNPSPFSESGLGRVLSGGEGGEGEETIVAQDGVSRPVAFRVVPLGPGAASDEGAVIELIDLSGETGTSRALRESEQRLRLAVEASGIGIWDVNAITGERRWSPELLAILGLAPDTEADWNLFSALIHPDERDSVNDVYRRAYESPANASFNAEFRIRPADGAGERWIAVSGRVSYDASGRPLRGIGTVRDVHQRRQYEQALRENEERLRVALTAGRMGTWRADFVTGEQQWDATQYRLFGISPSSKPSRELFLSLVHPDDLSKVHYDLAGLPPPGTFIDSEFRIVRPDGAIRWIAASSVAGYDAYGRPVDMIGINRDVTEQKVSEAALRMSEERNRLAIEATDVGTWDFDMVSGEHRWSTLFKRLWGLPADSPSDPNVLRPLVGPMDWEKVAGVWREATHPNGDGKLAIEYRIQRADDGAFRWCAFTGQVFFDETSKKAVRALGIMTDVTERREVEERQRLILREMNHRVKNSLALVQSIVSQTIRMTADPGLAFERIQSRLMSLARTHDFLNRGNWAGTSLRTLINGELEAFAGEPRRLALSGGQVLLDSSSMFALGLTFHELGANAVKHGALSVPEGRVEIEWRVTGDGEAQRVEVTWVESGGPPVTKPTSLGFGSRLIEANIRATLGGDMKMTYARAGLRCTLSFPLRPPEIDDKLPEQGIGPTAAAMPERSS